MVSTDRERSYQRRIEATCIRPQLTNNSAATIKHMTLRIPNGLAASCRKTPERTAWLDGLGDLVRILEARWSLTFEAPFESDGDTSCSYVTPVVFTGGTPAV